MERLAMPKTMLAFRVTNHRPMIQCIASIQKNVLRILRYSWVSTCGREDLYHRSSAITDEARKNGLTILGGKETLSHRVEAHVPDKDTKAVIPNRRRNGFIDVLVGEAIADDH